jgi:hypothetical protein
MIAAGVAMLSVFYGSARGAEKFENVAVYLEQTAEDEDCEIAFEAVSATAGLAALKVVAPDGRTVIDFRTADSKLGMQHLTLESPEPKNDGRLQADFPAGVYKFMGASVAGGTLGGEATLSHRLPGVTRIVRPRPDENRRNEKASAVQMLEPTGSCAGCNRSASVQAAATKRRHPNMWLVPGQAGHVPHR